MGNWGEAAITFGANVWKLAGKTNVWKLAGVEQVEETTSLSLWTILVKPHWKGWWEIGPMLALLLEQMYENWQVEQMYGNWQG